MACSLLDRVQHREAKSEVHAFPAGQVVEVGTDDRAARVLALLQVVVHDR